MLESETKKRHLGFATTMGGDSPGGEALLASEVPVLTLLAHPDLRRVGERVFLTELSTRPQPVSRLEPDFAEPEGGPAHPLACGYLSRTPILLETTPEGGIQVDASDSKTELAIDGNPVTASRHLQKEDMSRGVVLLLADRIALLLHLVEPPRTPPHFGLVGESPAMVRLRCLIERLAPRPHTVLLRGETGTGKELVARALHEAGERRRGPFRAVNMAAVPAELAASELFGAGRGAYTGAGAGRDGYFAQASGGTLFLDEIGDAPAEVQAALLRVLETSEIQPVGAAQPRKVDVRVIAGTDANLEQAAEKGDFRAPLLHRLGAYQVFVPPLRERRDDIGRLFVHFLQEELQTEGRLDKLEMEPASERSWVPASLIARLTMLDWPGNVRQLKNLVKSWVLDHLDDKEMRPTTTLERLLGPGDVESSVPVAVRDGAGSSKTARRRRRADEIDAAEIHAALDKFDYKQEAAAKALGVARSSLIKQMDVLGIPRATSLTHPQIESALKSAGYDLTLAARRLKVSEHSLKMRLRTLEEKSD